MGGACGAGVAAFHLLLRLVEIWALDPALALTGPARYAALLAAPALGCGLGAWLCAATLSELRGAGVEEVSQAIFERGGAIPGRVAVVKLVASALTLGTGGSGGREGPVVQIGAAVGSSLGRRLPIPAADLRVLAAAGASAGLAGSFGVPLTAVVFTMEVLLRDFASEAFPAVVAASATAAVVSALLHPSAHLSSTAETAGGPLFDLALACVPAVLCGAAGAVYMRSISAVDRWRRGRRGPLWAWAAAGGLVAGAVGCLVPEVLGTGDAVISGALTGQALGLHGAAAAGAKIVATAATLGSGGSGGAFMPAMFIGSALGAGCRSLLNRLFALQGPRGLFPLAGMSCAVTTAYRAPLTAIVLALEIARGPQVMGPIMVAVALSHLLTRGDSERRVVSE